MPPELVLSLDLQQPIGKFEREVECTRRAESTPERPQCNGRAAQSQTNKGESGEEMEGMEMEEVEMEEVEMEGMEMEEVEMEGVEMEGMEMEGCDQPIAERVVLDLVHSPAHELRRRGYLDRDREGQQRVAERRPQHLRLTTTRGD